MKNNIIVPVEEAIIDYEYDWCNYTQENGRICHCGPSITYKGNGIGWSYNNPNSIIENIVSLERPMTWEEEKEFNKKNFYNEANKGANQLNLFGLFNDCYIQGSHEMYNGWVGYDFYELCKYLNEEGWVIVGIADAPYEWTLPDPCVAIIAETEEGDKFWCHVHKYIIEDMRAEMREEYEKILKEEK